MIIDNDMRMFFSNVAKSWQNFKDYSFFKDIELSKEQRAIVDNREKQLLIEGYAGTGKSITLLYKFINSVVQEEGKKILYVTFNQTLIDDTKKRLNNSEIYIQNKGKHEAVVATFHEIATRVLGENKIIENGVKKVKKELIDKIRGDQYRRIAAIASGFREVTSEHYKNINVEERLYKTHDDNFLVDEITWIKAMGFIKKEKYLEIERKGRSNSIRLTKAQRNTIFKIFEKYQYDMEYKYKKQLDLEDYALKILECISQISDESKFDYIFVDEVQDLDPMQIAALAKLTKDTLVLSGDAKQRIYKKTPVKYEDIGIDIKRRKKILNKNYRSTEEIVKLANDLVFFDNEDKLEEKIFVKHGTRPMIFFADKEKSLKFIINEIKKIQDINKEYTIAIVNREEIKSKTGYKSEYQILLEKKLGQRIIDVSSYNKIFDLNKEKQVFYTNSFNIKGLEFDVVFIMDFNKFNFPNIKEIKKIREENEGKDEKLINKDIAEFENIEKKLLYVAMSRAKNSLYLISNEGRSLRNVSPFIFDLDPKNYCTKGFAKKELENHKIENDRRLKNILGVEKFNQIYK